MAAALAPMFLALETGVNALHQMLTICDIGTSGIPDGDGQMPSQQARCVNLRVCLHQTRASLAAAIRGVRTCGANVTQVAAALD